jgi:hypothetical protein
MNLWKIHKRFVSGRILFTCAIVLFILLRLWNSDEKTSFELWGLIVMQIGIAFSLLYLNHTLIAIRNRSFLPFFFYLLFSTIHPIFYCTWFDSISVVCICVFLFLLFSPYLQHYPQGVAFNIALILTLGSFIWQPLLFFFLILWLGLAKFHGLNFRSFVASLSGFAVIYLFIFAGSIYIEDSTDIFMEKLPDFQTLFQFQPFEGFELLEYIILGYLFLLFIIAGIHIFMSEVTENARAVTILSFFYIITGILFIVLFLQPQWKNEWTSILSVPLSILVSHLFSKSSKKANIVFMLISIAFFIGMSAYTM